MTFVKSRYVKVIFLFLISTTFFSFDKILPSLVIVGALVYYGPLFFLKKYFFIFVVPILSFFVNFLGQASYNIFFLPVFVSAAHVLYENDIVSIDDVLYALTINVTLGVAFALFANLFGPNLFSFSLWEKGLPDLYAPMGFSPTQQVFGTLCIINLIICLERRLYSIPFWISLVGVCATFNRCSLLFCCLLFAIYKKGIFLMLFLCCIPIVVFFWGDIYDVFFSLSTLVSRAELREGVDFSYWHSNNIFVYVFGNGNIETLDAIARKTEWGRSNVENGLDFLFHSYGILGFVLYSFLSMCFIFTLYRKKVSRLIPIVLFYLFFEQFFTQEFVSSSFLFFLITVFLLSDLDKKRFKLLRIARKAGEVHLLK